MDYQQLRLIIPKYAEEWTNQDVSNWLKFVRLQQYVPQFQKKQIDGSCLNLLDEKYLIQQLGIKSKIICKKIINWIRHGLPEYHRYLTQTTFVNFHNNFQQPDKKTQVHQISQQNNQLDLKKSIKIKQQWNVLFLKKVQGKQSIYYKFKERDCRLGSNPNCEIIVNGDGVDQFHTLINFRNQGYYLCSTSKKYVTFVKVNNRVPIYHDMKVQMGSNIFQFKINGNMGLQIKIVEGKNSDYTFKFLASQTKILIGRKPINDISFYQDNTLSNLHARITFCDLYWFIQDLATTNGTWIQLDKETKIQSGVIFKLGMTNHQFECQTRRIKQHQNQQQSIITNLIKSQQCVLCNENIKNILFSPCNHCEVCEKCVPTLKSCILCHQKIINYTKIFKS